MTWNFHSKHKVSLLRFSYLKLFICPPDVKRPKFFRDFAPLKPYQSSIMNSLQSLEHLKTLSFILQHLEAQSSFRNGQ